MGSVKNLLQLCNMRRVLAQDLFLKRRLGIFGKASFDFSLRTEKSGLEGGEVRLGTAAKDRVSCLATPNSMFSRVNRSEMRFGIFGTDDKHLGFVPVLRRRGSILFLAGLGKVPNVFTLDKSTRASTSSEYVAFWLSMPKLGVLIMSSMDFK